MASKGPRRKPTHLKLLEGNPGKRSLPVNEPAPPRERPSAPRWLSNEARREWRYIVPRLDALGLLTKIDRTALEVYCESVAIYRAAIEEIHERGVMVDGQKGTRVKNPAIQIQRDAARLISSYGRMFGLSPGDRAGMEGGGGTLTGDAALALSRVLSGEP